MHEAINMVCRLVLYRFQLDNNEGLCYIYLINLHVFISSKVKDDNSFPLNIKTSWRILFDVAND